MRTKRSALRFHHHVISSVVPHAGNEYHPHLVRWQGIVAALILVIGLQLVAVSPAMGSVLGSSTSMTNERLLEATNHQRQARGFPLLVESERLSAAAELKARDMLAKQYWSHVSPAGVTPWQWVEAAGYEFSYAGENLGKGFHSPGGVVQAWMDSPEHRANLLGERYRDVGFAVAEGMLNGEETNLIVALYGSEKTTETALDGAVLAATNGSPNIITRIGIGLQSLSPAALGSVAVAALVAFASMATYLYRHRSELAIRRSWKAHHGLYKAVGMTALVVVIIALYGGGQI